MILFLSGMLFLPVLLAKIFFGYILYRSLMDALTYRYFRRDPIEWFRFFGGTCKQYFKDDFEILKRTYRYYRRGGRQW